ncbi:uncharacterized protein LOC132279402 [Cornus florida]|uniref:uncharacterized protein LOC132279402 n=1 Tax=Cornus florida TaxID=4283 RepID=UPI00289EB17B|nr:uncharacterized protein LOC132279402 [Cornus florida]
MANLRDLKLEVRQMRGQQSEVPTEDVYRPASPNPSMRTDDEDDYSDGDEDEETAEDRIQPGPINALVVVWCPSPTGIVKCNFDTSFCRRSLRGGGGAVFWDFLGEVLHAVIFCPFHATSPLEAEALVCQRAILCAFQLGFSCLWFESDAKVVADGVLNRVQCPLEIASLCYDIQRDLRRFSSASLTHVHRNNNMVAHALAALSRPGLMLDQMLTSLPPSVIPFALADVRS